MKMLQKLQQHIAKKLPFLKGKKLLVAISGGVDSVVLTQLLITLGFDVSLAHCNFNLRGQESDMDALFVAEIAKKHKLDFFTTSFDTHKSAKKNKESTQIAARNLRYHWFHELCKEKGYDFVLTAHHADDNLETFLINLTRGSGLDGFTGIPVVQNNIVRPLLIFSRKEITNYATENNIIWREDLSNGATKYTRNKIRHQVIPVLKEINPSLLETFAKTIENLKESKQIVKDRIKEIKPNILIPFTAKGKEGFKIDIQEIDKITNPKMYLFQLLKSFHFTEYNDIVNLLSAQSGKQVFSQTHVLLKDRAFLILTKIDEKKEHLFYTINEDKAAITTPIPLKLLYNFKEFIKDKNTIYVDKEKVSFPLLLRKWENGDAFYPIGMNGRKKISKYFKDEKLSLLEKEEIWLLCNANNTIIWVLGKRQDKRFCSTKKNKNSLQIQIEL